MKRGLRLARSLMGRFALVAALLFITASAVNWFLLRTAIEEPAEAVVENRLLALARELRGYWATAEITGVAPFGPGDVELVWQIETEDGAVYRSDLLFFEDIILPAPDDLSVSFVYEDIETPIGSFRTVMRRLIETVPAAPGGGGASERKTVTYWAAITTDRRAAIMEEHAAPFERAALRVFSVLALLLLVNLVLLGIVLHLPLRRLRHAAARFEAGAAHRIEGDFPSEIETVVSRLNDTLARSEALVERTRRYIGKIGHDLKHPLAIARNALDHPDERDMARRRLAGMEALLDRYTTLAAAVGPGKPEPAVHLLPLIEDIRDGMALIYRRTPLAIDIVCDADIALRLPRQDLEAMLTNLVTNASKHARSRISIEVVAGNPLRLTVADDGPGLTDEERRRALGWGERLDLAPPGSGFGLAIVKDLVELHDGSLTLARSAVGGLEARIELPTRH